MWLNIKRALNSLRKIDCQFFTDVLIFDYMYGGTAIYRIARRQVKFIIAECQLFYRGGEFFLVLNSVRVPNIQLLTYTQIFVESPLRVYRGLCYNGVRHIRYPM